MSMRVAVDAMGGDNAPAIEVEGAVAASRQFGIPIVLVGDEDRLRQELDRHAASGLDIAIRVLSKLDDIGFCYLTSKDVVRHPLVQKIVKAYETYESKESGKDKRRNSYKTQKKK